MASRAAPARTPNINPKNPFCSQFVTQGARQGEDCLYVTMHGTKSELVEDMSGFEFGFERAYALGVAASLGDDYAGELGALRAEMDTAYETSVVELAFDEFDRGPRSRPGR